MSSAVTLAFLLTEVRRRANQETTNQAQAFVTDPEIRALLNTYLGELYDLLVENRGQDYYRSAFTINTVNGTSAYALPADFYKLLSVDVQWGQNIVRPARAYTEAERNDFKWLPLWNYAYPVYYQLQAGNINFVPNPQSAIQIVLNYIPAFTKFATDGSQDTTPTLDGVNGWEDFAIWGAVAAINAKEETDPSFALNQQASWRQRVQALAESRDVGEAPRVQRIYRRTRYL